MRPEPFSGLAAAIFMLIALAQLARAALGWPALLNGYAVPVWASWAAFVIASALSIVGFRAAGRN